jgi:RHS repeat-associated protein
VLSTYGYGASNERVMAEEGGGRTYFVWGGGVIISEYSEPSWSNVPQWSKSYVYLGGRLLATLSPGAGTENVQYQHPDRLGTRLVTNGGDANFYEQATLPYGTALASESTTATNRRFTSYDRSNVTGLDYAVNRHYDPQQGRFTQADPIGMSATGPDNPQSLNLYAYCGGDPVNCMDPDGLFSLGGIFRAIGHAFAKVFKWAAAAAAVLVAFVGIVTQNPGFFIISALLFGLAFGPPALQRIIGAVGFATGTYQRVLAGMGGVIPGGTGVFNPDAASGLGSGVSAIARSILHFQDDGAADYVVNITICKNGRPYPYCGAGWWGLVPVVGPAWDARDDFKTGHWGWGIFHTAEAITDVFLVKSLVKAGVKGIVRGSEKVLVRHYTDDVGKVAIESAGHLRPGTFVTLSSEIPAGATGLEIESLLEIQPGRGANYFDIATRRWNLRVPGNGVRTSGGALQYQLRRRVKIR